MLLFHQILLHHHHHNIMIYHYIIDYFSFIFTLTVKCFNFSLISYYSLFISITYVIFSKYLYSTLSIKYLTIFLLMLLHHLRSGRMFGFVAKKSQSSLSNQCHVFTEVDPQQPASAIVNFISKVLISGNQSSLSR